MSFGILSLNSTTAAIQVPGIQGSAVQPSFNLASASTSNTFNPFSNPNGPFANLNLSTSQENQIDSIFSTAKSQGLSPTQVQSQVDAVLTPSQQQTLQSDVQTQKAEHHHHHHHGGGSEGSSQGSGGLLSQLDLSSDQQNQITSLLQGAQTNGTTPSNLLSSISSVLTGSQQQQLTDLFEPLTYSSTGSTSSTTNTQPYLLNTSA